jgi:transcriptional regulator of arginine metabolism
MLMNKYSSAERHGIIEELLRSGSITSQEELQSLLKRRGLRVAQATLSRDLHELGVAKTPSGYVLPSDLGQDEALAPAERRQERLAGVVRDFVTSVAAAASLVVVKTTVAAAQPVARAIDEAGLKEIVGTIGGDDTIFLATASNSAAAGLVRRLRSLQHPSRSMRRPRA